MEVGHKQVSAWIEVWFESNGTAYNVGVRLNQFPAVDVHHVWIVDVGHDVEVEITCGLLNTQQDVVYALDGSVQDLGGFLQGFFTDCLSGIMQHDYQRGQEQQGHGRDYHQTKTY
jgi:hypothetical protein